MVYLGYLVVKMEYFEEIFIFLLKNFRQII